MIADLPPPVFYLGAALILPLLPRAWRGVFLLLVPLLSFAHFVGVPTGEHWRVSLLGYELVLGRVDRLSVLFTVLFHLASLIGFLYSLHVRDLVQQAAATVYAGSALGAVLAGDLVTFFVFWELLAVSSVFLVWARRTERAYGAGLRYLVVQLVSGLGLLAGILVRLHAGRPLTVGALGTGEPGSVLILLALGLKCAFPLLHNWLIDAYPEATPTGTVFLSAFTTKAAVYALARMFAGTEVLVYVGAVMTVFPIFYAVIENDLRRVLSYSMVNQLGFMVTGVGIGTPLALNGAVAHAFADVLFKGLLFMSMGAVLLRVGSTKGTDLGGLYKSMPWTATFCVVGAASISAFPLFSAFVTKSMVLAAAAHEGHYVVWWMLLFASAGVLEHAGIKVPFFAFYGHDAGLRTREPPLNMLAAMGVAAGLCVLIGSFPTPLYRLLPYPVTYVPYTVQHVVAQVQLLLWASLGVYTLMRLRIYPPEVRAIHLDFDWVYRRAARAALRLLAGPGAVLGRSVERAFLETLPAVAVRAAAKLPAKLRRPGWTLGASAVLVLAFLVFYLALAWVAGR